MPTRIYPIRPYGRRYAQPAAGGDFQSGWKIGSEIGKGLGGLAGAIKGQIDQSKRDAVANQLLNQGNWMPPPRAGLVAPGVNPQTGESNVIAPGVSTAGTAPASGGVEELNMRIAEAKARMGLQQQQFNLGAAQNKQQMLEQAYRNRGGGGRSPWSGGTRADARKFIQSQQGDGGGGGGKAKKGAYVANSSTPDDPEYYNYNNQRADVDARYGKGIFDKLQGLQGVISPDPKTGKWVSAAPDVATVNPDTGDVTLMGKGGTPGVHISAGDLTANMKRYDATTVQHGGKPQYIGSYMKSQAPETGKDAGAAENPFLPQDRVDLNAIPPGSFFVNPTDGKVHQKQPSQQPQGGGQKAADTSTAPDTSAPDTSAEDTGDEDLSQVGARSQGTSLAQGLPPAPPTDFGKGDLAGLPQDPVLAEALRRAQTAQSLMA